MIWWEVLFTTYANRGSLVSPARVTNIRSACPRKTSAYKSDRWAASVGINVHQRTGRPSSAKSSLTRGKINGHTCFAKLDQNQSKRVKRKILACVYQNSLNLNGPRAWQVFTMDVSKTFQCGALIELRVYNHLIGYQPRSFDRRTWRTERRFRSTWPATLLRNLNVSTP